MTKLLLVMLGIMFLVPLAIIAVMQISGLNKMIEKVEFEEWKQKYIEWTESEAEVVK